MEGKIPKGFGGQKPVGQDWSGLDVSGGALECLRSSRRPQTPPEHAGTLVYVSVGSSGVAMMFTNHPGAPGGLGGP